eukprot:366072-Chlamydomonas_euryale.AAC.8
MSPRWPGCKASLPAFGRSWKFVNRRQCWCRTLRGLAICLWPCAPVLMGGNVTSVAKRTAAAGGIPNCDQHVPTPGFHVPAKERVTTIATSFNF